MWRNLLGAVRETIVLGFMMATVGFIVWNARVIPETAPIPIDHQGEREITPTEFEYYRVKPLRRLPPVDSPTPLVPPPAGTMV